VPESLFSGYVVNYDYNFALGGLDTVTVYCADQFYLLAQTFLDELNVVAETSGERIETVLDLPEVDFPAGARVICHRHRQPWPRRGIYRAGRNQRAAIPNADQRDCRVWATVYVT
jgi:hypothetical protein